MKKEEEEEEEEERKKRILVLRSLSCAANYGREIRTMEREHEEKNIAKDASSSFVVTSDLNAIDVEEEEKEENRPKRGVKAEEAAVAEAAACCRERKAREALETNGTRRDEEQEQEQKATKPKEENILVAKKIKQTQDDARSTSEATEDQKDKIKEDLDEIASIVNKVSSL